MKKFLCALLALGMTFAAVACGGKGGNGDNGNSSSRDITAESSETLEPSSESEEESSVGGGESASSEEEEGFKPDYTSSAELTEYFKGKTGAVTYNTGKNLTVQTLTSDSAIYLGDYDEENVFTVDGGPREEGFGKTLTVNGYGAGVIQADGGILVLKNLTIKDATSQVYSSNGYKEKYLHFGGKIRFEDCTIDCSIQLMDNADVEFVGCTINSVAEDLYSIWVSEGKVKISECTFTGYRGIKLYEQDGFSRDVKSVTVENCVFNRLSKKPAIAIDIEKEYSTTAVTFTECYFEDCADWAKDSLEGVKGFYESDQDTTTFTFSANRCYLDGMPFDFEDGELTYIEEE